MKEFKTCERIRKNNNKWRNEHKEYFAAYQRNYNATPLNRAIKNAKEATRRIKNKLLQNNKVYASDSACLAITGCNFAMLRFYLIKKFIEKRGHVPDFTKESYEIDHIMPLGSVKDEETLTLSLRYDNLQLVPAKENRLKMQQDRKVIQFLNPKQRKQREKLTKIERLQKILDKHMSIQNDTECYNKFSNLPLKTRTDIYNTFELETTTLLKRIQLISRKLRQEDEDYEQSRGQYVSDIHIQSAV